MEIVNWIVGTVLLGVGLLMTAKLSPFALLEFETTDEAWDAFYQASGHTWIDYDHIANARAALKAGGAA